MGTNCHAEVQVGSVVRIRSVRRLGSRFSSVQVSGDESREQVVTIVGSDSDMGLWRLSPRTPLGGALLGHRSGDVVAVRLQDVSAKFEVVAVEAPTGPAATVSEPGQDETVRVGSAVRVRDGELVEWWRIVPAGQADALARRISEQSPLAVALLGHQVGDRVRVQRSGDRSQVTILAVDSTGSWA